MKKKASPQSVETLAPNLIQAWRQIVKSPGPSDYLLLREFSLCYGCVSEGWNFLKEGNNWFSLWERSPLLGAYMVYFWPLHYQQALALFLKLGRPLGRVLDVGSGPGPFTLAAIEWGGKEVYALDANDRCLSVLSEFIARLGHTLSVREWNFPKKLSLDGCFDTIVLGHSFLEMTAFMPEKAVHLIFQLLPYLAPGGKILIVEYEAKKQSRALMQIHRSFLSAFKAEMLEVNPLEKFRVLFEKTRLMGDIARALKLHGNKSDLMLMILSKPFASAKATARG